jgi:hypothetical protein
MVTPSGMGKHDSVDRCWLDGSNRRERAFHQFIHTCTCAAFMKCI